MNELQIAMGRDMKIEKYHGESDSAYLCRLYFSGLGLWCLKSACTLNGISKSAQTRLVDNILNEYQKLAPDSGLYFSTEGNIRASVPFSVMIRQVYEETGYLLLGENGKNLLSQYARTVPLGGKHLYYGVPSPDIEMNGLGVFLKKGSNSVNPNEAIVRDQLEVEQFFKLSFDECDFENKDIELRDLEFFSPRKQATPSRCWGKTLDVDCTVCRKGMTGPYYRVMRLANGQILFSGEEIGGFSPESLLAYDYRRLYYTIKAHYNCPAVVNINELDVDFSEIKLSGELPNREYYFMLLMSWPKRSAFDRTQFIIRNEFLEDMLSLLRNLGIEYKGER